MLPLTLVDGMELIEDCAGVRKVGTDTTSQVPDVLDAPMGEAQAAEEGCSERAFESREEIHAQMQALPVVLAVEV